MKEHSGEVWLQQRVGQLSPADMPPQTLGLGARSRLPTISLLAHPGASNLSAAGQASERWREEGAAVWCDRQVTSQSVVGY